MTDQGEVYQGETHQFSTAHYRLAMKAAGVGMWDWDLRQNKLLWNNQCRALFGLSPEKDVGVEEFGYEQFRALIYPPDRESIDRLVAEHLRTKTEYCAEYRVIWPDGSLHWMMARGRGIYDDAGEAVRMIGVAFDVTAKKEADDVQRRADRRVSTILESVDEAFIHLDPEWRFTYINSRAAHIGGYIPETELLGRTIWEVYTPLVGTQTERYFHQVMETRQPIAYEIYYDDIQSWYDIRAYPAEDGGITVFLTDISERKALEQERDRLLAQERAARIEAETARRRSDELVTKLEHRQAFFHAVVNQTPCGLFIAKAPGGRVIIANEESSKVLGHELIQCNTVAEYAQYHAFHLDGRRYLAEEYPLARGLSGEVIMQEHSLYQQGDGTMIHLSSSAAPIRDAAGEILASVTSFHDVSDRYELERKKDEFISMASHELRTPLTSIKGNLQLVQRRLQRLLEDRNDILVAEGKAATERLMQWNERALRQVNVESRLINDLLDASRIQTGRLRVSLEPGNLVQIVNDAVGDAQASAEGRAIDLELPQQTEIPVMADSVRIGQVITNYLTNALKYSPEDEVVTVGLSLIENEARVWVKDAGPGIAPEALGYIWDRFRQVGSFVDYTRLGGGGLGLGLYINHALIQLHAGRSGVESTRGKGSTFWFTLPLTGQAR
ncbi:MAG TPA: PAS domain S-box protein [Ktedonobacteraceae bacterium]|nr:PAS domain S-box protein [Ktedonobacteraceae bacterium]